MAEISYPLFVPPSGLSAAVPKEWSATQADEYMRWLTSVLEPRSDAILARVGESLPQQADDVEQLLLRVGAKAQEMLRQPDFSESTPHGHKLTDRGFALAADLGLLVARLLLKFGNGSEQWTVLRRPKTDAFYNHPVITGLRSVPLEPVGGSIAEAHAVLRGARSADAWQKIFSYWHIPSKRKSKPKI